MQDVRCAYELELELFASPFPLSTFHFSAERSSHPGETWPVPRKYAVSNLAVEPSFDSKMPEANHEIFPPASSKWIKESWVNITGTQRVMYPYTVCMYSVQRVHDTDQCTYAPLHPSSHGVRCGAYSAGTGYDSLALYQ